MAPWPRSGEFNSKVKRGLLLPPLTAPVTKEIRVKTRNNILSSTPTPQHTDAGKARLNSSKLSFVLPATCWADTYFCSPIWLFPLKKQSDDCVPSKHSAWYIWPFHWRIVCFLLALIHRCIPQFIDDVELVGRACWKGLRPSHNDTLLQTAWAKEHVRQRCIPVSIGPLQRIQEFWCGHPLSAKLSEVRILFWITIHTKSLHLFSACVRQMSFIAEFTS